jgi:hypothetical protein
MFAVEAVCAESEKTIAFRLKFWKVPEPTA